MIIQDVVDLARYSELGSVALKDNVPVIMLFLNAGMLELHKRFPLRVEEHIVNLVDGTTEYALPSNFMYPLSAHGEASQDHEGVVNPIAINEESDPYSIFFPNHRTVQIPLVATGSKVSVIYNAKPTRYDEDDLAEELDLPETLIECLLHYIGYKAHLGIKGDEQAETNSHYIRFDRSCKKARELGVAYPLDSWCMKDRLGDRGFV